MRGIRDFGLRFAAALTCGLLSASLITSCTKGTKNAAGVRASATNWKATPGELKNQYPPNKTILDPIKFVVTTKEGSPVPNINVEFKAFDVTPAYNGGVSTEAMKAEILNKWSDGNYVMNSSGSIAGNTCDAGFTRDVCVGMLSGPSKVTNQNGEATVGLTTPNAPGGVIAVALRVPEDSTASELIEIVLVKITSNDDFANSGIEPLQSAFIVIPLLFDDDGRQVIQAGVPFNLAIYAPGIPNTAPGKGFMFDFVTEGLQEAADGSSVLVPSGSKRCEFRNSQCIVPGGPFRVLKPTTLSFSARPSDPKFPVKPASFSIPVTSGKASQLIVALSPDTKNIQNACVDGLSLNKPCLVMSADTDKKELYPMLLDAGGNWVESPDTVWEVEGPLNEPNSFTTEVINGKQELRPRKATPAGTVYDTIRVTVKGKSTYTIIKYAVTPGTPRRIKFSNTTQKATVPFPALMELRDQYENFCYNFSDMVGMRIILWPLTNPTPTNGLEVTVTKIDDLDRTVSRVKFTNGLGTTAAQTAEEALQGFPRAFIVSKRPPLSDTTQWPRFKVVDNTLALSTGQVTVTVDANPLQINPGRATQTLWRDASGGGGANWSEKTEIDPVTGVALASDQQYNFYLAGYDAAANYSEDLSDVKYWGVKHTLDDKDPNLAAVFKSTVDQLFLKNPSAYSAIEACPKMAKTPSAGRPRTGLPNDEQLVENDSYINPDDQAVGDQPEGNAVFCGIHLGLSNKGGMSSLFFNSKGIPGTGRILAIPNGMYDVVDGQPDFSNIKIKPALSPKLSLVAGAATKFAFEMVSAEPATVGQVLVRKNMDDPMPTGHRFKLRIYAQDSGSTDASTYKGIKLMQVLFIGEKSWAGLSPTLPNANFSCNFGETISAACEIPDSYMLTDSRSSATLAVKQLTNGGVQGTFAKIMTTTPGQPARLIFASKKGGPSAGALVENSFERPLGRQIGADSELPLAVAVLDAGGSYVRDALSSDSIVFDGFRSEDGSYRSSSQAPGDSNIFNPETGQWKNGNGADWSTSYELSDVFVENSLGADTTPPKFYSPDDATTPPKISLEESKNTLLYSTVFVPQNRFGSGFAVPRSSSNPNLIGWPSSWWTIKPGDPDHIETVLTRGSDPKLSWSKPGMSNPSDQEKTNWVETSNRCYDVKISIHDKKHNLLYNYSGVVDKAALKLINVTGSKPGGVDDLKAGTFAVEVENDSSLGDYYLSHNANRMPGPFRDGFYIPGTSVNSAGPLIFKPSGKLVDITDLSNQDWWKGRLSVNAGIVATGVKVCLYNGQTSENYTSASPFAEKYLQLDMPAFTVSTAQTTFNFPAFQSRGAGVRFVGAGGQTTGGEATAHIHKDLMTVFRAGIDHLHPTFTDSVSAAANGGQNATFRQANGDAMGEIPAIGITTKCPAPKCAGTQVYWHEHDATHNFLRPAVKTGFTVDSTLAGAVKVGPDGPLGSPSALILDSDVTTRNLDSKNTQNMFSLYARNASVNYWDPSKTPLYTAGAAVSFLPGPPRKMKLTRTGASTITAGDPFGISVELLDEYYNPAGGFIYGTDISDLSSSFNVPRTLSLRYNTQPSNGPTSGQPSILHQTGAGLANPASPVTTVLQPSATQPRNPYFSYSMNLGVPNGSMRLAKANESLVLNVELKDNQVVPWCSTSGNCQSTGVQTFTGTVTPIVAVPGPTESIAVTNGVGSEAQLYPAEGSTDPDVMYSTIFNTNPDVGDTYPLGISLARTFRAHACGRDQFGNISECELLNNFEFLNLNGTSPPQSLSSMENAKSFSWRATKPGSFAIKATRGNLTITTAPIKVASRPLKSFEFTNITQSSSVTAGSQFEFKVCMLDEAGNVITDIVKMGETTITDPNAELTVGFSLFGMSPNPEGKSLELSKGYGEDFDSERFALNNALIKFNQGCATLYAKLYAASVDYSNRPLLSVAYIDPMQEYETFSGSGVTIQSVTPLSFDHFATGIRKAPIISGNAVVPAYANADAPGSNIAANVSANGSNPAGNRFDLDVFPRDVHGNGINYTGNVRVKLQVQEADSPSPVQLICESPGNDNACMSQPMSGSALTITNLAMNVSGLYFVFAETTTGLGKSLQNSAGLMSKASLLTIKDFYLTPSLATDAFHPDGVGLQIKARDADGNAVTGIAEALNDPSKIAFTWIDFDGTPMSSQLPPFGIESNPRYQSTCKPNLPRPIFDNLGVASAGAGQPIKLFMTKTRNEAGTEDFAPKINISAAISNVADPIRSNNSIATQFQRTGIYYDLICSKVSDGSDCSGALGNPFLMDASPESQFNLTVKSYDRCGNLLATRAPFSGINLRGGIGEGSLAGFSPRTISTNPNIGQSNAFNGLPLGMGGLNERVFEKFYVRAVGDASYYISDPGDPYHTITNKKVYHRYRPTLATVDSYSVEILSSTTLKAGETMSFKLSALDAAGRVVSEIDELLKGQDFTWSGGSTAPNGDAPIYPTGQNPSRLNFVNGVANPLTVTFRKAEQIPDFYVKDDFQKGPSGVLGYSTASIGADPAGKRRSFNGGIFLPISIREGLPNKFVLSPTTSTTVKAGSGFDVKVAVFDSFDNFVNGFGSETLTFSWLNASPSVTVDPATAQVKVAEVLEPATRVFEAGGASFTTTGGAFKLYRANANAPAPLETPRLKVVGSRSGVGQTVSGNALEATLDFMVQPADQIAYTKIGDASTFSAAANFSGKTHSMSNDQSKMFHGHLFDMWGNYKGTSPLIRWSGSVVLENKLAPDQGINTTLAPTLAGQGVVTASCTDVAAGCVSDSTGTITVNPSPLVSFDVKQISPPEGTIVAAGQQIDFKLCMLDKNQQVITQTVTVNGRDITIPNGPVSGISMSKTVHVDRTGEDYSIDISKSSGDDFEEDVVPFALNTFTFVNGCVNLYAKVYKAGPAASYGMTKPLISFAYTDTEQNFLPVGGTGLRVGAVNAGEFHHYATHVADLSPTGTVPAWADPTSSNIFASVGGNRFSVSLGARDQYGNGVKVTKTVTLRLARVVDGVEEVLPAERLKCAAASPGNDQSCLTRNLSNIEGAWIANLAVDIPGDFFIHATDTVVTSLRARSTIFKAESSKKTVKSYALTVPATIIAGQQVVAKIEARDAADQVIKGADNDLRSLRFDWLNGASDLISSTQVSPAPAEANPFVPDEFSFNAGVANVPVTLVKATTGQQPLTINVRDRQNPTARSSNNTITTAVSPGSQLRYAITCTNAGGNCSGSSTSDAASVNASPSDSFNLQIKAFDQYDNPKSDGASLPAIKLSYESGNAPLVGFLEQLPPVTVSSDASKQILVPMSGSSQASVQGLFHRAGPHVLSFSIDPNSATYVGMQKQTFHSYNAHIDMVYNYEFSPALDTWPSPVISGTTSMVAGTPQTFKLQAKDRAGNIAKGIDGFLNAQKYLWNGPGLAPSSSSPDLPGPMTGEGAAVAVNQGNKLFDQGEVAGLSVNFKKAETIADFFVADNYVPAVSGVGGFGLTGKRRSTPREITNPLTVLNARPHEYLISTVATTVRAGVGFDVVVSVVDQFRNPAKTWQQDNLNFTWENAGLSVTSPDNTQLQAATLPSSLRSFDPATATFATTGSKFKLYKAPETPTLKVTGTTIPSGATQALSGLLQFTSQPSTTYGAVKIASSLTYNDTTKLSGLPQSMATNDTKSFFAHMLDPWGNYIGSSAAVRWTGTAQLEGKLNPQDASSTVLTANQVGGGVVTASCASLDTNCLSDSTGYISVGASPIKEFVIEHVGTPAEGDTVSAGTAIAMQVCMLDKAGQRITDDVTVDTVLRTRANDPILPVTIFPLAVATTPENNQIQISRQPGNDFASNLIPTGIPTTMAFTNGCSPFWVKLYAAANYVPTESRLQINHTSTLQEPDVSVTGAGLKITRVNGLGLHHFSVNADKTSSTPQANSVSAQAVPDNVYAKDGGSRFDIIVNARDEFGNSVTLTNQQVNISTVAADKVTARPRPLVCPQESPNCLTPQMSGASFRLPNLAIDVGGILFYPVATSGGIQTLISNNSIPIYAASSDKTVKEYVLSYPLSVTAGEAFTVGVVAKDVTGANVQGSDSKLSDLYFSWYDGATTRQPLSTHIAPDNENGPMNVNTAKMSFAGGSASRSITLTKAEGPLLINVQDDQDTPVKSTSAITMTVGVGSQTWWELTCTRAIGEGSCNGTSTPATFVGPEKFSLTLKSFDQYKNEKRIIANPEIELTRITGAASTGQIEQFPNANDFTSIGDRLIMPMTLASNQSTAHGLFRRSATQSISMAVKAGSAPFNGMRQGFSVYHSYTPTIDSVYQYALSLPGFSGQVIPAGTSSQTVITAQDSGYNAVDGIQNDLNQQAYTWFGIGAAPNGLAPVLPGVTNYTGPEEYPSTLVFDGTGKTAQHTITVYKAEALRINSFGLRDNYNGSDGLKGFTGTPYRHSMFSMPTILVKNAEPSKYVLSAASTTPQAGSAFNVKVTAVDQYLNTANDWSFDNLTFTWTNAGKSLGAGNPVNSTELDPGRPASAVGATFGSGVFDTAGTPFVLYKSNFYATSPQEVATLTVTGSNTTGTKNGVVLTDDQTFTVQPASAVAYVKIAKSETFSDSTNMSRQALSFVNNQVLNLYAHVFDAYGNYKNRTTNVTWSGSNQLSGKVSPTLAASTQVTAVETGSGKVTADCSTISGCINDETGTIGIVSTPLASFSIEHVGSPASGATVTVGDEIALKICMRDEKNQIITEQVLNAAGTSTITNPDIPHLLTFTATNISNTNERGPIDFSTVSGGGYGAQSFGQVSQSLPFTDGCTNIYAKVYKAATPGATTSLMQVSYSDLNQGKTIVGSGLKLAQLNSKGLDHFVTVVSGLSSTPEANSTQAWSVVGTTNSPASSGGNRFNVTAYTRDMYGNEVQVASNTTVNLSLLKSDGSTPAGRALICSATDANQNGSDCLSPVISAGSNSITVNNVAVDIGGQYFYVKATDGANPFVASNKSTKIYSVASRKTIKEYKVIAPSTMQAGVNTSVTVRAVDNSSATITGADDDLNSATLSFEWIDGASTPTLLSARVAPDGVTSPILPAIGGTGNGKFIAGSATVNTLSLMKRESGLIINVRDSQSPVVRSNNLQATDVTAGSELTYLITCLKDTGGAIANGVDCTGSQSQPATISAAANDRFRLSIKPFDQFKNPRAGQPNQILSVVLDNGTAGGMLPGFLEKVPSDLPLSSNNLVIDTSNPDGVTIPGLFHRAGNHVVTYSITGSTNDSGKWGRTYHTFTPSIHMVHSYQISTMNNHTAGFPQSLTMTAYDRAGNIAKGENVDTGLSAQTYQWFGPTGQVTFPKTGSNPTAPNQVTFTNGVSESLNFTFSRAESVNFSVRDNYSALNIDTHIIGGTGSSATRISNTRSFTVANALANSFAITPSTTIPMAGSAFGVRVTALDQYGNRAFGYNDSLTISWQNAATVGPDAANAKNPTSTYTPSTMGTVSLTNGQYDSGSTGLMLYKSGQNPLLRVQGSSTSNQLTETLSQDYTFATAVVPNTNHGFVKVTSAPDYNPATELSGPRDITTDQTATLFAHMFDDFGNWKGNTFPVVWSGSGQLENKLPTPGFTSTLAPNVQGSGQVTATCSGLTTGCVSYTTGLYTVNPGLVSKFVWLSPTPTSIDQTTENCVEYRLQVQDQQNNPVNVSADYGITFRAVKAGVTDTSGDFFKTPEECQAAQVFADGSTLNTSGFHNATTFTGGAPGNRTANISQGSNAVSVYYANRTTTAAGAASLTATSGTVSNSRTGQIKAGPTKRFAVTTPASVMAINSTGAGSSGTKCGEITYKFQDKWGNDTPLTAASTVNFQTSSGNGAFWSDIGCTQSITGGSRSVPSATAQQDTVYYSDSRSNRATITLLQTSSLSGNPAIEAQTRTAVVSPNSFAITAPASNSPARNVSGSLGPLVSWDQSTGAQNYTVTHGSTSACGTSFTGNTTTGTSLNLPTTLSGETFVCVVANGFSGGTPVPTLQATNTGTSPYRLQIDNGAPTFTASVTVPATGSSLTPTVSFGLSEAATVTLYSNSTCTAAISAAVALASGSRTMPTNSLQPNTSTTIYAQAVDAAGNKSACNDSGTFVTYIHDNINPTVSLFTITSPGNSRRPSQSFTLSENATVTLYSNSGCTTAVSAPTSVTTGTLKTVAMNADLTADASSTVYAVAVDPAGNSSTCAASGTLANYTHDGTAPTVTSVTSTTANGQFKAGGVIDIDILFTETVTASGSPQLAVNSHASSAIATYLSGSGTNTLKFRYTVSSGQSSNDLDVLSADALANGTIQDAAGNAATRTLPLGANANSLASLKNFVIDSAAPTFSSITVPARGTSQTPSVSFTLSEATKTNGLILYSNDGCTAVISATLTGVSGVNNVSTNSLTANGSTTIYARATDLAENVSSCQLLGAYIHDNQVPTVTSVTSDTDNGHLKAAQPVNIQIVFTETVTFSGNPTITLETGTTDAVVAITGGNNTTTLTGTYTVAAGHTSADLDYTATNALTAGTFIRDLAGNDATLTLPAVGGAGSLAANKALVIDTTAPVVSFSSITPTGPSSTTTPTVKGTTSDTNNTGVNVVLYFGADCTGTARGTATQANFTSTGITVNASVTLNNSTPIRAIATDQAGNPSTCTLMTTYIHDNTGPTISGMPTNATVNEAYTVGTAPTVTDTNTPITYSWAAIGESLNGCTVNITNGSTLTPTFSFSGCANNTHGNFGIGVLTLTATDAALNSSTANFTLTWDAESPRVTSINVNDTTKGNKFYKSGDTIPIDVTFIKTTGNPNVSTFVVDVAGGTPSIPLNTGGNATYASGSGTRTLRFNYVVQSTDFSGVQAGSNLNLAASTSEIALNGATMRDRVGTNRNNAHRANLPYSTGIPSQLASPNNGSIIVDNVAPTAAISSGMPSNQSNNRSPSITVCRAGSTAPCTAANTDTSTISYKYVAGTTCAAGGYTGPVSASNSLPGDLNSFGQGDVTICLLATDPSGNTQTTATANSYTLDTIAPAQVNITAPTNNQQITSQPVTVSWDAPAADVMSIDLIVSRNSTCSGSDDTVESYTQGPPDIRLLGTATTKTLSASNLADGLYYICMYTYDTAGNKSAMSGRSFEIESDVLHISWTDNGGVKYSTKSGNGNWSAAESVANIGTMDSRSSLVVNSSGAAIVAFQYDDGTQSHYTYRRRSSANNWVVPGATLISTASSFKTGLFGEVALNNQSTAKIFASSYGYIDGDGAEGLVLTDSSGSKQLRVATTATTPSGLRDTSVTVDGANNAYVVASVLTAGNYRIKIDNSVAGVTADVSLPTSCADAPYVSSFARSSGVIGMAIACRMSSNNSCRVWWGETTFSNPNFSAPSWTEVGIVKASSCVLSDLTPYERPSITYNRQNNRVSIAWVDKTNKKLYRWSNENNGTGANEPILTMSGTGNVGQPSIALDKTGKSYIVYQDGDKLRLVHNNARPKADFIGSWSSATANEITTGAITGLGNIGITGMRGRSNTLNGN